MVDVREKTNLTEGEKSQLRKIRPKHKKKCLRTSGTAPPSALIAEQTLHEAKTGNDNKRDARNFHYVLKSREPWDLTALFAV